MEWVVEVIVPPFVHSANAGFEEDHASPIRRVSDIAGDVKCVVSKCIFIDLIAQFCWQPQQRRCFDIVCVPVSKLLAIRMIERFCRSWLVTYARLAFHERILGFVSVLAL